MVVGLGLELLVPHGLRLRVARVMGPTTPGIQPLRIQVALDPASRRPVVYVGSELVAPENLEPRFKRELGLRPPDWPVYVAGDPALEWRSVAEIIDIAEGQQAEVVLLTKSR